MRIAITGLTGRLGGALAGIPGDRFEVLGLDRAAVDLGDPDRIPERLDAHHFDVLVNAAAVTSPDAAEKSPELAQRVNGEAPRVLAAECRRRGARMIQVSTDYVFGGDQPGLRSEQDATCPVNAYGRSKLAGELAVLAADPGACVLRVSWLYGPGQPGFPEQVIERAEAGELELIADKFSLPTYLPDLLGWISELLEKPDVCGVVHACPSGEPASWFDWGAAVIDEAVACGRLASAPVLRRQSLDGCGIFHAARPRHTAMSNARLAEILGTAPRTWRDGLREHVRAGT